MAEPTTLRLVLAISIALKLKIDHLDIKTAFLNGEIPENERIFCSPPPGLRVEDGMGWLIKKGLYGAHKSGSIWAKTFRTWMHNNYPQYVEAGNERCVYVMQESEELAPINLYELRGLKIEKNEKIIIMIMNTDDMPITYSDNARDLVDSFERKLNNSFEATPRSQIEHYLGMHALYDQEKGILTLQARHHVYDFINHMGLEPDFDVGVSTPLDPHGDYSKADSPPEIDVKLRDKVWQAHAKLIHPAIWARPDLVHSVSVLGRFVHNESKKLWNAYSRIAKHLVKTRDLKLVYGTPGIELLDLEPYGHSDSNWGRCIDH